VDLFLPLLVLLVATRVVGELAARLGQPRLVGEIVAGLALGLAARSGLALHLPVLAELGHSRPVELVAELGVFFMILDAGIDAHARELVQNSRTAIAAAVGGMGIPLFGGIALTWLWLPEPHLAPALAVGVALSTTAVPVTARVLGGLGLTHSRMGQVVISAAVVDDVLGLVALGLLTSLLETGSVPTAGAMTVLVAKVGVFFALATLLGVFVEDRLDQLLNREHTVEGALSSLLITATLFAVLAESLGMHFIMGPFLAGVFFEPARFGQDLYIRVGRTVRRVSEGFLAPVFFASIGLQLDLAAMQAIPGFLVLLVGFAFLGKLLGAGVPARLGGLGPRESLGVGISMCARGAVGLIVCDVAQRAGAFDGTDEVSRNLFSAVVLTAIVTTVLAPVLLRTVVGGLVGHGGAPDAGASGS
jgi:Kef-type K+ transport system membrane component KefB